MKTPKKLLPLILFAIAATSLFSVQPAQAFTVTLEELGSNVVATGSGTIDLTGLIFLSVGGVGGAAIAPNQGRFQLAGGSILNYTGLSGPTSFGSGGFTLANSSSGGRRRHLGFWF